MSLLSSEGREILSTVHILTYYAIRSKKFKEDLQIATIDELRRAIWWRRNSAYRYSNKGRFAALERRIRELEKEKENGWHLIESEYSSDRDKSFGRIYTDKSGERFIQIEGEIWGDAYLDFFAERYDKKFIPLFPATKEKIEDMERIIMHRKNAAKDVEERGSNTSWREDIEQAKRLRKTAAKATMLINLMKEEL